MTLYAAYVSGEPVVSITDFSIGGTFGTSLNWKMSNQEIADRIEYLAGTVKEVGQWSDFPHDIQVIVKDKKLEFTPYVFTTNKDGKEIRFELNYGGAVVRGGRLKEEYFSFSRLRPKNKKYIAKKLSEALKRFAKLIRES